MVSGIPNQNMYLYGPGPFKRIPKGPAAGPALPGLVKVATQGVVIAFTVAMAFKYTCIDPQRRGYKKYYEENP